MAATLTVIDDPYKDGLGKASQLGLYFLRKVRIDGNASATAVTINASDVSAQSIVAVQSIVMRTNHTAYVSTAPSDDASSTSCVVTLSANTAVADVYLLCRGM